MAALIAFVLSCLRRCEAERFYSNGNVPSPQVLHKYLNASDIQNYKEIFIIGDVHGCYDEMIELIKKAHVEKDSSLKVFVGDLVNKGPKSQNVLDYMRKSKSSIAVRGNHDEVVLRESIKSELEGHKLKKSNAWIKNLSPSDISYLIQLPYTITIEPMNAVIVHAGLIPGISLDSNDPYDMIHMRNLVVRDYFSEGGIQAIKDTSAGEPWASLWPGPQHIYFGHDAKRGLQLYPNATGLDTGCVYGRRLTGLFISGPKKGKFVKVKSSKIHCPPKVNSKVPNVNSKAESVNDKK